MQKTFKSNSHWMAGSLLAAALNMSVSTANAEEPAVLSSDLTEVVELIQVEPTIEETEASYANTIEDNDIIQDDSVSNEENESNKEVIIDTEKEIEVDQATLIDLPVENFSLQQIKLAPQTHSVKSGEYLYLIAERYGITVDQLKQWNKLSSNYIYTGDQLIVTNPTEPKPDPSKPIVDTKPIETKYHTVKPGDYLWKIATAHNVNVDQIKQWNKLTSNYIYSGDRLIVSNPVVQTPVDKEPEKLPDKEPVVPDKLPEKPAVTTQYHTVKPGDYLWKIATTHNITVNQLKAWNKLSSNYIYSGDRLAVSDPSIPKPVPEKPVVDEKDKDKDIVEVPVKPVAKYHSVKAGDYLWLIATQNGVTVNQLREWNKLSSNYIYVGDQLIVTDPTKHTPVESLPEGTLTGTHQAVQAVLNQYKNSPIHVFYESLLEDDLRTATLRGDDAVYGASVPKVVLIAYTLDQIEKGNLSWDTPLRYTSAIYNHTESYAWGGSGTIQYENYQNKAYTLKDVVFRTIAHSDNLGSNMLLHHVGYRNKADFDRFTQTLYGAPSYTRTMTPRQINKVMSYINTHSEQYALTVLDKTNYDNTKLDTVAANVYQKIGAWWPYYNHSTAIVDGTRPYIVTVLTDYWSDSSIASLAKQIFSAVMR